MKVSRSEPGVVISSAAHAGLLVAALVLFPDAKKFDDVEETIPVEIVTDNPVSQAARGEKSARVPKPTPRADRIAKEAESRPLPPIAEAKKDVPTPPPPLKRLPDPVAEDKPEPMPPKRIAALTPAPEPPTRPAPEKKPEPPKPVDKPAEAKPAAAPPVKPKFAPAEAKEPDEPKDAEIVRPKPPARPKPEKEPEKAASETPKPEKRPEPKAEAKTEAKAEKPKTESRLKADDVAKLLDAKKAEEKAAKPENSADGEAAEKSAKGGKPKSGDENAPKSKFDAASIANLLSREAPQRRAAAGKEIKTASLGAPKGAAPKMSASMEARIASYIHDHYHPCWASALSLGGATFAPVVEFRLTRDGALEGRPRLLNPSANPVEQARGEQALQAVRRCSPMKIPSEFMPYYEEALHEVTIRFEDAN